MTTQFENFPNPPIQEALIDFRVGIVSLPTRELMKQLILQLGNDYPVNSEIVRLNATFAFDQGVGSANQTSSFGGLRFESPDRGFVFQAQVDGFTISKLKPYRNWEELLATAKDLWSIYRDVLLPTSIERIACRYINRIEVKENNFDLNDYLAAAPKIPENLPQGISRYLMQQEIPVPVENATVVFTQTLEGVYGAPSAFLMDIDVFKVASYAIDENQWWADLERLRLLKNRFFFESITEKAKALFR